MAQSRSPLRYPGGKSKIYERVRNLIITNSLTDRTYVEPFAGGFGIGIGLLCDGVVQTAVLNDFDPHIYNFWYTALNHTENLIQKIVDTPITLDERSRQKTVYNDPSVDVVNDGFATFFLNRVNFSGVINAGPIGGYAQNGTYKIDCRFNKTEIIKKINQIALLREYIKLYNCDANELISIHLKDSVQASFFNIDPPYVKKGCQLYANYFQEKDHKELEKIIEKHLAKSVWIVTYDDCRLIREIYSKYHLTEYSIQHNAGHNIQGKEVVITNITSESFLW